jgi:hypothetical protein
MVLSDVVGSLYRKILLPGTFIKGYLPEKYFAYKQTTVQDVHV